MPVPAKPQSRRALPFHFWPFGHKAQSSQRPDYSEGGGLESILDRLCEPPENWWEDHAARINPAKFAEIAQLLDKNDKAQYRESEYRWTRRPRLFTVLHNIGRLDLLDFFATHRLTDFSLPFNEHTLPDFVEGDETRRLFLWHQQYVLTEAHALEEGGPHMLLDESADVFFHHIRDLGQGSYGTVDHVFSLLSLRSYARKRVLRGPDSDQNRRAQAYIVEELTALKALSHEHLVQYIGSYTDKRHIGFLMSPVADMDLHTYLSRMGKSVYSKTSSLRCFYGCLAGAMEYLHKKNIDHRDIKPENILVKDDRVFISDFGTVHFSAATRKSSTQGRTFRGTLFYVAPEVAHGEAATMASDIWSLGIVFLEISTVLLGSTLQAFNNRLSVAADREKRSKPYVFNHINEVYVWMDELRRNELAAEQDNETLVWTRALLKFKPQQRLNAAQLMQLIHTSPSFSSYCCLDCQPQYAERSYTGHGLHRHEATRDTAVSTDDVKKQVAALFDESAFEEPDAQSLEKKKTIENWITSLVEEDEDPVNDSKSQHHSEASSWLLPSGEDSYLPFAVVRDLSATTAGPANVDPDDDALLNADSISNSSFATVTAGSGPSISQNVKHQQGTALVDSSAHDVPVPVDTLPELDDPWNQDGHSSHTGWLDEPARQSTVENPWAAEETASHAPRETLHILEEIYTDNAWDRDTQSEVIPFPRSATTVVSPDIDDRAVSKGSQVECNVLSKWSTPLSASGGAASTAGSEDYREITIVAPESSLPSASAPTCPQPSIIYHIPQAPLSGNSHNILRPVDNAPLPPKSGTKSAKPAASVHFADSIEIMRIDTTHSMNDDTTDESSEQSVTSLSTSLITPDSSILEDPLAVDSEAPIAAKKTEPPVSNKESEHSKSELKETEKPVPNPTGSDSTQPTGQKRQAWQRSKSQKANLNLLQTALQNANLEKKKASDEAKPSARQFSVFSPEVYMQQKWEAASTQATQDNRKELANLHLTRWLEKDSKLLESSCRTGKAQVVRHLLSKGCNPGTRKKPRPLPLLNAVRGGTPQHYKCVQALLKHGVNLNVKHFGTGKSALHLALETQDFKGHTNMIRDLAAGGAKPNIPDKKGELPIHALFKSSTEGTLEKYRLDALACILKADLHGDTDVNTPDPYDLNSPLHLAVSKTSPFAVGMLLYKGANVNAVNSFGLTPLLLAATFWSGPLTSDQEVILESLLKDPAIEIDRTSGLGKRTALHWAAFRGSPSAVRLLLERGADATIKDAEGGTPKDMYASHTPKTWGDERTKIDELLKSAKQHNPETNQAKKENKKDDKP